MSQKGRAARYSEVEPLIGTSAQVYTQTYPLVTQGKPLPDSLPFLRPTRSGILEVWGAIDIPVEFPTLEKRDDSLRLVLRTSRWRAKRGDILRPTWRKATDAEVNCLSSVWRGRIAPDAKMFGRELHLRILMHFDDCFALWRQLFWHIPMSYISTRVTIRGAEVIVPGKTQLIREMLDELDSASQLLGEKLHLPLEHRQAIPPVAIAEVASMLAGAKTAGGVLARTALEQAGEVGTNDAIARRVFEASAHLKEEELHHGLVMAGNLVLARRILGTLYKIQQGIDALFIRTGRLLQAVEAMRDGNPISAKVLADVEQLWPDAVRIGIMNPYCRAINSERGQGLKRAPIVLRAHNFLHTSRNLATAMGAMLKLVCGDEPQAGEITALRRRLRSTYPEQLAAA